jgi:hypothetical protein
MKVKELIQTLQKYPEDSNILLDGEHGGYDDVGIIYSVQFIPNYNKQNPDNIYGYHEDIEWIDAEKHKQYKILTGVVIR